MRRSSQASVPVLAQVAVEQHKVHRTKRASSSQRSKKRALVRRSKAQGNNACVQTSGVGIADGNVPRVQVPDAEIADGNVSRVQVPDAETADGNMPRVQVPDAGTAGEDVPEYSISELDIPWGYTLGRQVQHVYELVPDDERGSQEPENAPKGAGIAGGGKTRTWCIEGTSQPPQGYRLGRCTGAIDFYRDIRQTYELVPTGILSPASLQRLKDVRAAVKAAESKLAELEEDFNVR